MAMADIDFPKLISTLKENLTKLKGFDFESVEREERNAGNISINASMTPSFQSRLAARALDVNPHDLKELPLKQYNRVNLEVFNFLFSVSDEDETPSSSSEAQPQTLKSGEQ